jgi:hypothetical protein
LKGIENARWNAMEGFSFMRPGLTRRVPAHHWPHFWRFSINIPNPSSLHDIKAFDFQITGNLYSQSLNQKALQQFLTRKTSQRLRFTLVSEKKIAQKRWKTCGVEFHASINNYLSMTWHYVYFGRFAGI